MKKLLFILLLFLVPGLLIAQDYIKTHEMGDEAARGKLNAVILSATTLSTGTIDADSINITGDLVVGGPVSLDSTLMLGTFGDAQQILSEASSNTNVLMGVYPMVNFDGSSGKVFAGTHNRLLAITTNQTNNTSFYGTESQFRLKGVNIGQGVHAGLWAYAEQSGTSVLSGGGYFAGLHAAIESAAGFSAGATELVLGVSINSSINAGATIDGSANYSGLFIQSSGLDFHDGVYITGATNDIKLQNLATIENAVDGIMTLTEPVVSVAGHLTVTGGISQTATVFEYTTIVTIDSTKIVGNASGDLNHADGHVLVAAEGAGFALEFVSAFIIYDHATADFAGGGNDLVVQVGVNGAQVAMSGAVTAANLLTASADKMIRLGSTATELVYSDAGIISLYAGTAYTNDTGNAAGLLRVHITYRVHTTGL